MRRAGEVRIECTLVNTAVAVVGYPELTRRGTAHSAYGGSKLVCLNRTGHVEQNASPHVPSGEPPTELDTLAPLQDETGVPRPERHDHVRHRAGITAPSIGRGFVHHGLALAKEGPDGLLGPRVDELTHAPDILVPEAGKLHEAQDLKEAAVLLRQSLTEGNIDLLSSAPAELLGRGAQELSPPAPIAERLPDPDRTEL